MRREKVEKIMPIIFSVVSICLFIQFWSLNNIWKILIATLGLIIWWIGRIQLGDSFTALPKAKKLVSHGIYSKIRHPLYVGICINLIGIGLLINSIAFWILGLFVGCILFIRSNEEEKIMIKKFKKKYIKYKETTWF
ncbi:DUF1295 domain-containing protein [Candidatus Woesearchaeota archaeon]|jgi:protein-S-isoprenylcysteine O-methyltransferase Ste14|nr:DUF1295 domain-containing protein [Candidatus Woesearchaeota archaeon]